MKEVMKIIPKYRADKKNKEKQKPKRSNKKKTQKEYVEEVKIKNPNVTVIGTYINARTKILHKCNICNYEWEIKPSHILNGTCCPNCFSERQKLKRKTHEQFIKDVSIVNNNITIIGIYNGSKNPIECKCNKCGYMWNPTPSDILSGNSCPKCAKNMRKTNDEFVNDMNGINPNIEIIGEYVNANTPIKCKCKICNHQWEPKPTNIYHNKAGCPICAMRKLSETKRMPQKEFEKILYERHNNEIIALENYKGSHVRIKFKHVVCGYTWDTTPSSIIFIGTGCPVCNISHGEKLIKIFLENNKILFSQQKRYEGLLGLKNKKLSYDFYLPQYNLLIEFQGKQHEQPIEYFGGEEKFKIQQEHDNRKREFAKLHNINLLEIWYYDINNIEKILTETLNNLKLKTVETTGIA